jgi:hypothetical protein
VDNALRLNYSTSALNVCMKINFLIAAVCLLLACSPRKETSTDSDSTVVDTTAFVDEADSVYVTPDEAPDIRTAVDKMIQDQRDRSSSYYTLQLTASGYEYQTQSVWSFDSLLNLVHCFQDWSSDGTEGRSHHFFRQEKLYAVQEENGNPEEKDINVYHQELGGISYSESENAADSIVKPLDKKFFTDAEKDMKAQLAQIVRLLADHKAEISSDQPATLHIENDSKDDELPGKETTDISIDRKLLEELLK